MSTRKRIRQKKIFNMPQLILGSSSKYRQQIMRKHGFDFIVMKPDIDERAVVPVGVPLSKRSECDPGQLVLAISEAKAKTLQSRVGKMDCILITCDQVIHYQNTIREKPESSQQCREYLASYEKYPAVTVCGVVALNTRTGKMEKGYDIAKQHFKHIPPNIVDQLIAKGDIMHCAGGFMIDDPLIRPYLGEREGTEESIIGMPMHLVKELIAKCAEA